MFVDRGVVRFANGKWELARRLEDVEIPSSIQAVLAARLDTLPAPEKRATQDAAVVGRIFWDALIAHLTRSGPAVVRDTLRRLRIKELVVPREPSMLAGAAEFGFRHVLTRDVAYESLPKRERAAKHLDVARWAEEALADRTEEMVELLASHYLAALRYEEELGGGPTNRLAELRRPTYAYARRAGARLKARVSVLHMSSVWAAPVPSTCSRKCNGRLILPSREGVRHVPGNGRSVCQIASISVASRPITCGAISSFMQASRVCSPPRNGIR